MTKHLVFLTLAFGLVSQSFAGTPQRATQFTNIHQQYLSLRAAGMGGAFAAAANDEGAIFYNPATLARFTEGKMAFEFAEVGATSSFQQFANDLQAASKAGAASLLPFLQGQAGKSYYGRVKLLEMNWVRPKWGIAFVPADLSLDIKMANTLDDNVLIGNPIDDYAPANLRYIADTTFAYSYAFTIPNERLGLLNIGFTVKAILRQMLSRQMRVDDTPTDIVSADSTDGLTTDGDIGILYTPYLPDGSGWGWLRSARPTFAIVGRNLIDAGFGTKMISKTSVYEPEKLYRVYDVGMKFEIPKFLIFGGRLALDNRDMGHPYASSRRSLHTGFEFDWTVANWFKGQWRIGYGQGYASYGFSALFSVIRVDIASYGEDVGSVATPYENRITQLRLSGEF